MAVVAVEHERADLQRGGEHRGRRHRRDRPEPLVEVVGHEQRRVAERLRARGRCRPTCVPRAARGPRPRTGTGAHSCARPPSVRDRADALARRVLHRHVLDAGDEVRPQRLALRRCVRSSACASPSPRAARRSPCGRGSCRGSGAVRRRRSRRARSGCAGCRTRTGGRRRPRRGSRRCTTSQILSPSFSCWPRRTVSFVTLRRKYMTGDAQRTISSVADCAQRRVVRRATGTARGSRRTP